MCSLYLVERGSDVEWCAKMWWNDLNYGAMRNVMRCGMLQFQIWGDVECS